MLIVVYSYCIFIVDLKLQSNPVQHASRIYCAIEQYRKHFTLSLLTISPGIKPEKNTSNHFQSVYANNFKKYLHEKP